jgi:hypothetical protein
MFPQLPEEIERIIFKIYFNREVLTCIRKRETIWVNPSYMLFAITNDPGAVQLNYTDLERRYLYDTEPHCEILKWILNYPLENYCENCLFDSCTTCQQTEYDNEFQFGADNWWDLDFYQEFPERM